MLAHSRLPHDRAAGDNRSSSTPSPDRASAPLQSEISAESPWLDEEHEVLGNARTTDLVHEQASPGLDAPDSGQTPAGLDLSAGPDDLLDEAVTTQAPSPEETTTSSATSAPSVEPEPASPEPSSPEASSSEAELPSTGSPEESPVSGPDQGPVGGLEIPTLGGQGQAPVGGASAQAPGQEGAGNLAALDLPGAQVGDPAVADACLAPLQAPAQIPGPDGAVVAQTIDSMRASVASAIEESTQRVQSTLEGQSAQVEQDSAAALGSLDAEVTARQAATRQAAQAEAAAAEESGNQEFARANADSARDAAAVRTTASQRAGGYSDSNAQKVTAVRDAIWSVHAEFSGQMTRNGAEVGARARDSALAMKRELLARGEQYSATLGQDRERIRAAILDVKAQTLAGLQALAARRLQQLAGIGEQAGSGFSAMEQAASNALADGASPEEVLEIIAPQQASAAAAAGAVSQSASEAVAELQGHAAQGKAAMEQVVSTYSAELQRAIDQEASGWRSSRERFATDLRARVDEGLQPNKQMLARAPSAMQESATRAAEPFERSWFRRVLSGIGRAIFNFVVGLVLLVVVSAALFLVLVATGLAASTLAAFLAVLAAVGLVVLGVFYVLSVIQRTREYQAMGDQPWTIDLVAGLGIAVVSLGDVFGVTPILEGAFGSRAITGTPIDDPEVRAEMITGGLLMLATLGFARWGVRKLNLGEQPVLGPRANQMLGRSGRPQPTNVEPKFDLEFEQFVRDLEAGKLTEPRGRTTPPRGTSEPPAAAPKAPETAAPKAPETVAPETRAGSTEKAPPVETRGPTRAGSTEQAPITPEEQAALLELRSRAQVLRETYIRRPNPKGGNSAAAELQVKDGPTLRSEATSKAEPMNRPNTLEQGPNAETGKGGHYQPRNHGNETHIRDADSEFKILSDLTDQIMAENLSNPKGTLRLFTERAPCDSCTGVIQQFQARFPQIRIEVFFDIGVKGEPTPGHISYPALSGQ